MSHHNPNFVQGGIRQSQFRSYGSTRKSSTTRRIEIGSRQHELSGRVGVVKPRVGSGPTPLTRLDDEPRQPPPPPPPSQPIRGPGVRTNKDQRTPPEPKDSYTMPSFFNFAPSYLQDFNFDKDDGIYHLIAYETKYADAPLSVLLTQDNASSQGNTAPQGKPGPQSKPGPQGKPMPQQSTSMPQQDIPKTKDIPKAQDTPKAAKDIPWPQDQYGAQRIPGSKKNQPANTDTQANEHPGKLRITRIWSLTEQVEYFV